MNGIYTPYYVYVYLNPLKPGKYQYSKFEFEYEPFYIGMGKKQRINQHIKISLYKDNNNLNKTVKDNTILKILKAEKDPIRFKLYDNVTLESAIRLEKCLIKLIGRRNLKMGTLTNLTNGGEGTVAVVYTNLQRKKCGERTKNMWINGIFNNRENIGEKNPFFNKHHTEESKEKIRISSGDRRGDKNSNFNKKWTKEQKELSSKKQKESHKDFIGDNNPAKRFDVRKKISESKLGDRNPNAKKWILISPYNEEFTINGGIKRKLKEFNLNYQQFKINEEGEKHNKKGWKLMSF